MRFAKIIALTAIFATGASAVTASPFDANVSLQVLDNARFATVLTVNAGEARSLAIDVDIASLRQRINSNPFLSRAIENQGFSVDQIVGIDANDEGASVTLYAL